MQNRRTYLTEYTLNKIHVKDKKINNTSKNVFQK